MKDSDGRFPVTRRRALAAGGTALLAAGAASMPGAAGGEHDDEGENGDSGNGDGGDGMRRYRVTVANLTRGQPFTPPAVALHRPSAEVFSVGDPANEPTRQIAENGNLQPLVDLIGQTDAIRAAAVGESPLVPEDDPGDTGLPYYASLELEADASATHLTFIAMLVATNDGIAGLDTVELPGAVNESHTHYASGYDVGTEQNTELFADLVPPAKTLIVGGDPEGTTESNPDLAEDGVIRPHPGISGSGDLDPAMYDWTEPAALVQVERLPMDADGGDGEGPPEDGDDGETQTEFETDLAGENEVPPVDTDASGEAALGLAESAAGLALAYEITVEDIQNVVAAHVHCGGPNENGPVGVTLFEGGPFSEDGTLVESTVVEPDADNGCGWETMADVAEAMRAGEAYVNVHTQQNPQGEIRGQIE